MDEAEVKLALLIRQHFETQLGKQHSYMLSTSGGAVYKTYCMN